MQIKKLLTFNKCISYETIDLKEKLLLKDSNTKHLKLPKKTYYISIAALLLALMPMPYSYYTILRVFITVICSWYLILNKEKINGLFFCYLGILILFNPIVKIHLTREFWSIINIALSIFLYSETRDKNKNKENLQ